MTRLNLLLALAVVLSAFYLVHIQYESRSLYTQIDKARSQVRRLESEHEQLQVQKRAQATSARVQGLATQQLQMRPANPAITVYATWEGAADATTSSTPAATAAPTRGGRP